MTDDISDVNQRWMSKTQKPRENLFNKKKLSI